MWNVLCICRRKLTPVLLMYPRKGRGEVGSRDSIAACGWRGMRFSSVCYTTGRFELEATFEWASGMPAYTYTSISTKKDKPRSEG